METLIPNTVSQEATTLMQLLKREKQLEDLLGVDYSYAKDSGLIDMFKYDPETGRDGLMHTLAGEVITGEDGSKIVEGFHHEPSADMVWQANAGSTEPASTRVTREGIAELPAKKRREFREHPFEPFKAKVFVGGMKKTSKQIDLETGEVSLVETKNGMFPNQYDALAVMQAVRIARDSRDQSEDKPTLNPGGEPVITTYGYAPLLDGQTPMRIKLVLDAETEKVVTASPIATKVGAMALSQEAIRNELLNITHAKPEPITLAKA